MTAILLARSAPARVGGQGGCAQMGEHAVEPEGPFSLKAAAEFAAGFPAAIGAGAASETAIVMAFPVEPGSGIASGPWSSSAIAEVRQAAADGPVGVRIDTDGDETAALAQVIRTLSLDHDGRGWPDVGRRDPVIGNFQAAFDYLRPVTFYSAYEAATSFVIGQRISRVQAARIK